MICNVLSKNYKLQKLSRRRTCAASCSINTLRYLLCALHSTSMWLPLLRQRGHDIRPRTERCYPKTIRRIVFGWKRGESGGKHRTRLCRSDCVCPSRACRLFRHALTSCRRKVTGRSLLDRETTGSAGGGAP